MNFELNSRISKYEKDKLKRRNDAKRKLEKERKIKKEIQIQQEKLELQRSIQRQELLIKQEIENEKNLELQRITGGIDYTEILNAYPTSHEGDKVTLPISALEKLNPQDALRQNTALTFELSIPKDNNTLNISSNLNKQSDNIIENNDANNNSVITHGGVIEFTSPKGYIGIPPNIAKSLMFKNQLNDLKSIHIRYVRLEKGKFAKLQPLGDGFGKCEVDMKDLFERSLKQRITLTINDIILVRLGGQTFEVKVKELEPESQVSILNTDLEIDLMLSENEEKKMKEIEDIKKKEKEKNNEIIEYHKSQIEKENLLPKEPIPNDGIIKGIKCVIKLPDGSQIQRYFEYHNKINDLFNFVYARSQLQLKDWISFQLVCRYPRRIFTSDDQSQTFEDANLKISQERFFVEKLSISPHNSFRISSVSEETNILNDDNKTKIDNNIDEVNSIKTESRWIEATKTLISNIDNNLKSDGSIPIHALEPILPAAAPSSLGEEKWISQLKELERMGFHDKDLNINLLERYQGRLIRVINYLTEIIPANSQ